ncbi:MAG: transglutaminase domain-containing protein [Planctomycetota bacterium]
MEEAQEIVAGATCDRERLERIYYHVIDRVRYVGIELGRNGYVPHRAERTYRTTYGDCKDTAVLFVALLRAVGIDARVALVRTWDRGREPTGLPGAQTFNHAICYVPDVDGEAYWMDGTTDYNHFTELPLMDQGAAALISGPDGGRFVTVPEDPATANGEDFTYRARIDAKGNAAVRIRFGYEGVYAASYRGSFEAPERFRQGVEHFLGQRFPGSTLKDFTTSSSDLREKEVFFEAALAVPGLAGSAGRQRRVRPTPLQMGLTSRFAKWNERKNELIVGNSGHSAFPRYRRWTTTLVLPEGARPTTLPSEANIDEPFGSYVRTVTTEGNTVRIRAEAQIRVRRLAAEDYPAFRAFCHRVDSAEEEWLIYDPNPAADEDAAGATGAAPDEEGPAEAAVTDGGDE